MKRYFGRKLLIYALTFFIAVTINWMIPRFMPGNPVDIMISRAGMRGESVNLMYTYYMDAFGLDLPIWKQYLNFWIAIFHGDLGVSIFLFPTPVLQVIKDALPYDIALLLPSIVLSWFAGNRFGAMLPVTRIWITHCYRSVTSLQQYPICGWVFFWPGYSALSFAYSRLAADIVSPCNPVIHWIFIGVLSSTGSCPLFHSSLFNLAVGRSVCAT